MLGQKHIFFYFLLLLYISFGWLVSLGVSLLIPLGSRLSVEENNFWLSSNGDFAIAFFKSSNQYSVGIRFNSGSIPISEQAVVWVAGADLIVGRESYFQLTRNGELVLYDSGTEEIVWTSQTGNSSVTSAFLRDDGNLVLLNKNKETVWQSFDNPTDALLPGQNLSVLQTLRPPRRNGISSYYTLYMNDTGQLQLRFETSVIYWTNGDPSHSVLRTMLQSDGSIQLLDQRSNAVWSVFGDDHNDSDIKYRFLRLDADGNLRLYSWVNTAKSWRSVWQALGNQCDVFATCGLRGICVLNESRSHVCKCPFTSAVDSSLDCLIPYQEGCRSGSSMITYNQTLFYGIYPTNETIIRTSLQRCKSLCQEDPSCVAVSFMNDGSAECRIKKTRYVGGKSDPSLSSISFAKICSDPTAVLPVIPKSTSSPPPAPQKSAQRIYIPGLIGIIVGVFVVFFFIQFGIGLAMYRKRKDVGRKAASAYIGPNTNSCIMLTFSEIRDLTENFKHQIGAKVFKGVFPNHQMVAVKDLNTIIEERRFRSAISKIGSISHKNIVKLDGYCCESDHRLLVYEFAQNGSLRQCLEDPKMSKKLTWRKRMDICLTVAKAISYLHTGCREFVSHGNLKCENVVLDENLEAKVSEFGLTLVGATSNINGTAEKDVRDFGKMVLFLISGGKKTDETYKWAYEKWVEAKPEMVIDTRIEGQVDAEELERALRIAFWCLQDDDRLRPSMGEVVNVLEGTLAVDPPPPLFVPQRAGEDSSESDPEVEP